MLMHDKLSRQPAWNSWQHPPNLRIRLWLHQPRLISQAYQWLNGACPRALNLLADRLVLRLPEPINPHGLEQQIKILEVFVETPRPGLRLA